MDREVKSFPFSDGVFICIKKYSNSDLTFLNNIESEIWRKKKMFQRNGNNWVVGRLTAKHSIASCLGIKKLDEIKKIHIENSKTGVPVFSESKNKKLVLSISHSNDIGMSCCSLLYSGIGCDIEKVKKRHRNFGQYFLNSLEEREWDIKVSSEEKDTLLTITWSCKEACYKSLSSTGVVIDSLYDIKISPSTEKKQYFSFSHSDREGFGYWWKNESFIFSIALLD